MEMDKEKLRKMLPHLAAELLEKRRKIAIKSVRSEVEIGEKIASSRFAGYTPDVIAFIRRCEDEEQAIEIIDYMEKRGEITPKYAQKLRSQLKSKGLRSFGTKKEDNYYFKEGL